MSKIICVDAGAITFNAIYSYGSQLKAKQIGKMPENAFIPKSNYTYFNMILASLKRIGVDEGDKVFICIDGRNSWRKAFLPTYKGQRKEQRDKQTHIDWTKEFESINTMNERLENSTDWHFLKFDNMLNLLDVLQTEEGERLIGDNFTDDMFKYDYGYEADDIQAVIAKHFQKHEVVVVTCDKDIYQLAYFLNTKIYTLNIKVRGQKGGYVNVNRPLKIIADKVRLGDVSDNIIVTKLDTAKDEEIREFIIGLLDLPTWVNDPIVDVLNNLNEKSISKDLLPFPDSLAKKFFDIYKKDKILNFDYCKKLQDKREDKRKEKARERYRKKKEEKIK